MPLATMEDFDRIIRGKEDVTKAAVREGLVGGTTPSWEEIFKPQPEKRDGGLLRAFGTGLARGVTTELPSMAGGALEFVGSYLSDSVEGIGKDIKEWADLKGESLFGKEEERTGLEYAIYEGAKMLGPSLIPMGIIGTGARVLLKVGRLVKGAKAYKAAALIAPNAKKATEYTAKAIKLYDDAKNAAKFAENIASASTAALFGLSQAQQTYDTAMKTADELESAGKLEDAAEVRKSARGAALFAGGIEAGGEFLATKALSKFFRLGEAEIAKQDPKSLVKNFLKILGIEEITEIGQTAGEAAVEKYFGVRPKADPLMEALDVISPVAFMTLITGGLGSITKRMAKEAKPDEISTEIIKKAIEEEKTKSEITDRFKSDLSQQVKDGRISIDELRRQERNPELAELGPEYVQAVHDVLVESTSVPEVPEEGIAATRRGMATGLPEELEDIVAAKAEREQARAEQIKKDFFGRPTAYHGLVPERELQADILRAKGMVTPVRGLAPEELAREGEREEERELREKTAVGWIEAERLLKEADRLNLPMKPELRKALERIVQEGKEPKRGLEEVRGVPFPEMQKAGAWVEPDIMGRVSRDELYEAEREGKATRQITQFEKEEAEAEQQKVEYQQRLKFEEDQKTHLQKVSEWAEKINQKYGLDAKVDMGPKVPRQPGRLPSVEQTKGMTPDDIIRQRREIKKQRAWLLSIENEIEKKKQQHTWETEQAVHLKNVEVWANKKAQELGLNMKIDLGPAPDIRMRPRAFFAPGIEGEKPEKQVTPEPEKPPGAPPAVVPAEPVVPPVASVVPHVPAPKAKEAWEVRRSDWVDGHIKSPAMHKEHVRKAIEAGKITSHPDYPELTKKAEPKPEEPEAPAKKVEPKKAEILEAPARKIKSIGTGKPEKIITLRGAIKRLGKINQLNMKGEVRNLPLDARYLFSKKGVPYDLATQELKDEGWLLPEEDLFEVLRYKENLRRNKVLFEGVEKGESQKTPEEKQFEADLAWESEAPPGGNYVEVKAEDLPLNKDITIIESKTTRGWDTYHVKDKDEFSITLEDGTIIELGPEETVTVLESDLKKPETAKKEYKIEPVSKEEIREQFDLFGVQKPGQIELFNIPKKGAKPKEKITKKPKPEKRQAQIDLFTGKTEDQIQPELFDTFIRKAPKKEESIYDYLEKEGTLDVAEKNYNNWKRYQNALPAKDREYLSFEEWLESQRILTPEQAEEAKTISDEELLDFDPETEIVLYRVQELSDDRRITGTEEFKRKFAGSKVVDEKGAPLLVYRGTRGEPTLKEDAPNYFAQTEEYAEAMGLGWERGMEGIKIIPAYLVIKNPKVLPLKKSAGLTKEDVKKLRDEGFDGVIGIGATAKDRERNEYVVFNSDQVISPFGIKYSTAPITKATGITISDIRKLFKNAHIRENKDGSFTITRNGNNITVQSVEHIGIDEGAYQIEYGRRPTEAERAKGAVGSYQKGTIHVTRRGDIWTVAHEDWHHLEQSGLIPAMDIGIINNALKTEGIKNPTEGDRAQWYERNRMNRRLKPGLKYIVQKLNDLIDALVNLFHRTARGVLRGVEAGRIVQREGGRIGAFAPAGGRYAMAGPEAKTANLGTLDQAKEMKASGAIREAIWKDTGWWEIVPGQWAFEINESDLKWTPGALHTAKDWNAGSALKAGMYVEDALYQGIDLFDAYPQLRRYIVRADVEDVSGGNFHLEGKQGVFSIPARSHPRNSIRIIAHELQHAIQKEEGFARGGTPLDMDYSKSRLFVNGKDISNSLFAFVIEKHLPQGAFLGDLHTTIKIKPEIKTEYEKIWNKALKDIKKNLLKLKRESVIESETLRLHSIEKALKELHSRDEFDVELKDTVASQYAKLTGEAESRLVARRLDMTPKQRKAEPPWVTLENMMREEGLLKEGQKPEDVLISRYERRPAFATEADFETGKGIEKGAFKESAYRPEVVSWAKKKWGDQQADNGVPVWQNFVTWFGDSQVVNENREPLVVYHGTIVEYFDQFKQSEMDIGIHFGNEKQAEKRADVLQQYQHSMGNKRVDTSVVPVFLKLQNPLILKTDITGAQTPSALIDRLRQDGILNQSEYTNLLKNIRSGEMFNKIWANARRRVNTLIKEGELKIATKIKWSHDPTSGDLYNVSAEIKANGQNLTLPYVDYGQKDRLRKDGVRIFTKEDAETFIKSSAEQNLKTEIALRFANYDFYRSIESRLKDKGYDGLIYENKIEGGGPSYAVFDPTQIKSLYNRGTFAPEEPRISYSVEEREFERSFPEHSMRSFLDFKGVWNRHKEGWKPQKEDTTLLDRLLSVPMHHAKKVPAYGRMVEDGQKRSDDFYALIDMIDKDAKTGASRIKGVLEKLKRKNRRDYDKIKHYLVVESDRDAHGFGVRQDGEIFSVIEPDGATIRGTGYKERREAWDAAMEFEAKDLRAKGYSEQAVDAMKAHRTNMHNGFDLLTAALEDIIRQYEQRGEELPGITSRDDDGAVQIDLKLALAKMNEIRGRYFPRIRQTGRFALYAKKEGKNPIFKMFDLAASMDAYHNQLTKEGYKVIKGKTQKLPENVWDFAKKTVSIEEVVNHALNRITAKNITLKDFGLEYAEQDLGEGKTSATIKGPTNKEQGEILKALGGRWYAAEKGGLRQWHFENPGKDFEKRVTDDMAASSEIVDLNTKELFAGALAQQLADVMRARGHRMHMIPRSDAVGKDVWVGYEEDLVDANALYVKGLAAGEAKKRMALNMVRHMTGTDISWQEYKAKEIKKGNEKPAYKDYLAMVKDRRIDPIEQTNAHKEALVYMEDMLRNQEFGDRVIDTIRGIAVLKYIAGRVAALPVNLSALATSVPATMTGIAHIPLLKVPGLLGKASRLYGQYKFGDREKLDPEVKRLFDEIERLGWHTAQYNREALSVLQSRLGQGWSKFIDLAMIGFSATEQLNRVATIAGAYLGVKDRMSHDDALLLAKEVSDYAHAQYGRANYPYLARGSNPAAQAVRMFYVFRTFSHNYLLTMKRLGFDKEYKALAYMALSPAILAGAGASVATPILTMMMRAFGFGGDDPEEELYKILFKEMGPETELFARYGIMGLMGMNLKGSLAIGITDLPTNLKEFLGAPGSIGSDIYYGGKSLFRGDVSKGIEKLSPNAIANVFRAYRESTEGATTWSNTPLFFGNKQVKADETEAVLRALSFSPAKLARISEIQYKEKQVETKYNELRDDIYARIKRYFLLSQTERTRDKWADILADIMAYNERARHILGMPIITNDSIMSNLKRAMRPPKKEQMRRVANE